MIIEHSCVQRYNKLFTSVMFIELNENSLAIVLFRTSFSDRI